MLTQLAADWAPPLAPAQFLSTQWDPEAWWNMEKVCSLFSSLYRTKKPALEQLGKYGTTWQWE